MKKNNSINVAVIVTSAILIIGGVSLLVKNKDSAGNNGNNVAASAKSAKLAVGEIAPEFSFKDMNGNEYNNENLKGKNVVLFFNEGLMCYPACWEQIVDLSKDNRFAEQNTVAISVVTDAKESWKYAINKMPELGQSLTVFDDQSDVSRRYGMLTMRSSMHFGQLPGHSYVLIDKDGFVRFTYDDPSMANNNDRLIAEIQKLK